MATGIADINTYNDPSMWADRYQEFLFGAVGTGIAIGDYDLDGLPDVVVVNKCGQCRLYRNLGNWKFADVTQSAGLSDAPNDPSIWKQGAAFADVDNDGFLDLYLCRFGAPNLFFRNDGHGHFTECGKEFGLDIVDGSGMAYFCDYDRDGWLDLYLAVNILDSKHHPSGQVGHLMHNEKGSGFLEVTRSSVDFVESQCHSAAWWDYDNDGWPDLYVANDYGAPDHLYRNLGNGRFEDVIDRVIPHTAYSSMGCDVADINNDGRQDLLVADMAARTHEKDQRSIADSRARFSKDAFIDDGIAVKYHRNALLLNTGAGRCLEASFLAGVDSTDWTWSVLFGDFDSDGFVDLYVTNGMLVEQNVDLNNRMMSAESAPERIRMMHSSLPLLERNLAFKNSGDLGFRDVSALWGIDQSGISFGAAAGDLDGDGYLDLVVSNYLQASRVYRNRSMANHRLKVRLKGTRSNIWGIGAHVEIDTEGGRQTKELALGHGYLSTSEPLVFFGLGRCETVRRLKVLWPSGIEQVFENLPADSLVTIEETGSVKSGTVISGKPEWFSEVREFMPKIGTEREEVVDEVAVQSLLPRRFDMRGPSLVSGCLGGAGPDAIVVGGSAARSAVAVLPGPRGGNVTLPVPRGSVGTSTEDGPMLFEDFDQDGMRDVFITKGGSRLAANDIAYEPEYFHNTGHGLVAMPLGSMACFPSSAGAVAAADFNRDGVLDLFLGGRVSTGNYPLSPRSALWEGKGGAWADVTDTVCPALRNVGMVTGSLWTDVDNDHWPDLLLTLEWGCVKYFHNRHGVAFDDWSERSGFSAAGVGWWTSISCGDFNGDGVLDYAVGNVGLNTQYKADVSNPAVIYAGDPDENGSSVIIEGYFENGILFPWRTRRDLAVSFPWIMKRYPRNDVFAKSSMVEIFGPGRLDRCLKYEATRFQSGVFLSVPDGRYEFHPLPRIGQISPTQALVVFDADGDGNEDIYALQNSFAPIPCVGRFDGGVSQLFRGDGTGGFLPIQVTESGLMVPGAGKEALATDCNDDGWPDLLVAQNEGELKLFKNNTRAKGNSLRIDFVIAPQSEVVPGARLIFSFKDGSTKIGEMHSNSGGGCSSSSHYFIGYPCNMKLDTVTVCWPSGRSTRYYLNGAKKYFELKVPRT